MHTIEIPGYDGVISIPSDWNELDRKTVLEIVALSMKMSAGVIDEDQMIIGSFYVIAQVKRNWRSILKERLMPDHLRESKFANTYQIAKEITGFLFLPENPEQPGKKLELNFDSVLNFLPVIQVKRDLKYRGPKDLLSDLTFGEFIEAMNNMNAYFSSKDEQQLNDFIAALYRPGDVDGIRAPMTEHYRVYSKPIGKIPAAEKFCILLWFTTCIKYIKSEDLDINGSTINFSVLFPSGASGGKKSGNIGWQSLLYGVAKEGLFGDIRATYTSKLFDVLLFMYDNHYKQLKLNSKK